MSKPDAMCAQ